jgi:hypothetical protein
VGASLKSKSAIQSGDGEPRALPAPASPTRKNSVSLHGTSAVMRNSSNADGKMSPGQGSSVDHTFTETPVQEIPSSQTETAASTPVLALASEINRNNAQANPDAGPLADRQDSARAIGPKARNASNRSSAASRSGDVKRRLIELWHQSLAKSESRSWTAFSNLTSGAKKKAAYTAEKNH